jgi:hypothetical protein
MMMTIQDRIQRSITITMPKNSNLLDMPNSSTTYKGWRKKLVLALVLILRSLCLRQLHSLLLLLHTSPTVSTVATDRCRNRQWSRVDKVIKTKMINTAIKVRKRIIRVRRGRVPILKLAVLVISLIIRDTRGRRVGVEGGKVGGRGRAGTVEIMRYTVDRISDPSIFVSVNRLAKGSLILSCRSTGMASPENTPRVDIGPICCGRARHFVIPRGCHTETRRAAADGRNWRGG